MSKRRVKLYALNAERQWDDRGTGHVTSVYIERLKGISLLVRAETDGSVLLESKILPDTAYQKQQGTLIVWSEGDNFDLALSFQEKAGCDEIWERICQVQGKDPSVEITQDLVEESEDDRYDDVNDSNPWVDLPHCELSKLELINESISSCLPHPIRREKIAVAIENEGYIKKLISLFNTCEDLENIEGLHLLYEIFKNIFLLNKTALFEIMFADDTIFDVVGALEYDPSSSYRKRHRQFLISKVKFKEVIPIENLDLLNKIHQTYRVQYIQDVVLPPPAVFEENMLSTLSSFVFFNKVEIVTLLQEDERFLTELFHQLSAGEDEIPVQKRKDLVFFVKEFCTFSQTLQPTQRDSFFKTLSSMGVLYAMEITLSIEDNDVKSASIDILSYIVEYSPSMVREYMMAQELKVEEEQYLLNIIIEQMVLDTDPEMGGAVQLMGILRILIDPENMMATVTKSERTDFLIYFYKHSMHALVAPLLSNTAGSKVGREDYPTTQLLALILDLLTFCVEHHTYHIKNYIVQRDLLTRILVLLKSVHAYLVLGALRFMRKIISLKDEFYSRHIVNTNLFRPVLDCLQKNGGKYNLLDSAILEMFEFIRSEDIWILYVHIIETFSSELKKIDYVKTFQALHAAYEAHLVKKNDVDILPAGVQLEPPSPGNSRFRRDARELEMEEELWFNDDEEVEDEEQENNLNSSKGLTEKEVENEENQAQKNVVKTVSPKVLVNSTKENSVLDHVLPGGLDTGGRSSSPVLDAPVLGTPKSSVTIKKVSLVDYDGDSDEENENGESSESLLTSSPLPTESTETSSGSIISPSTTEVTSKISPHNTNASPIIASKLGSGSQCSQNLSPPLRHKFHPTASQSPLGDVTSSQSPNKCPNTPKSDIVQSPQPSKGFSNTNLSSCNKQNSPKTATLSPQSKDNPNSHFSPKILESKSPLIPNADVTTSPQSPIEKFPRSPTNFRFQSPDTGSGRSNLQNNIENAPLEFRKDFSPTQNRCSPLSTAKRSKFTISSPNNASLAPINESVSDVISQNGEHEPQAKSESAEPQVQNKAPIKSESRTQINPEPETDMKSETRISDTVNVTETEDASKPALLNEKLPNCVHNISPRGASKIDTEKTSKCTSNETPADTLNCISNVDITSTTVSENVENNLDTDKLTIVSELCVDTDKPSVDTGKIPLVAGKISVDTGKIPLVAGKICVDTGYVPIPKIPIHVSVPKTPVVATKTPLENCGTSEKLDVVEAACNIKAAMISQNVDESQSQKESIVKNNLEPVAKKPRLSNDVCN